MSAPGRTRLEDIAREALQVGRRSFTNETDFRSAGVDRTPIEWLLSRSATIDLLRQALPQSFGGYGKARLDAFDDLREMDPKVLESTTRLGDHPELIDPVPGRTAKTARLAAQFAGAASKDVVTQGLQNIWWFLNAYEAASLLAGKQAMHGAMQGSPRLNFNLGSKPVSIPLLPWEERIKDAPIGSPFTRDSLRFAAAFPLVLGAAAATGTLFRQPGYAAVLPSTEDKRQSTDPLTEGLLRAVGRTGALLPYDEFVRERPDVSKGEYEAYKSYLFGNKLPIKFNADGIHGPEVNFIGKSVPLLTGILPVVGGVLGARTGLRMAGKRLAGEGRFTGLSAQEEEIRKRKTVLDATVYQGGSAADKYRNDVVVSTAEAGSLYEDAVAHHAKMRDRVELDLLGHTIVGGSAGLGIVGAASVLLEQVRRARNEEENRLAAEQASPPVQPAAR